MNWDVTIGLETHVQLLTKTKIFSRGGNKFGKQANTVVDFIDLGLPGVLPSINPRVVELAVMFGLAVNAKINKETIFARKNYFYPDLPKGYQISQLDNPIVSGGSVTVIYPDDSSFIVPLTRAHLEEDAGKSIHDEFGPMVSGIDFNRAGVPLLEIVTEPTMVSAKEAINYSKTLHNLVTWIGITDGNMQEGSFRMDANVSVKPKGSQNLGTRCEIKNLNSFKFLEKAIEYETNRQIDLIESGGKVIQQTRLFDSSKNETREMRGKENSDDYRYFPDPDIPTIYIDDTFIEEVSRKIPLLPIETKKILRDVFELHDESIDILISKKAYIDYFYSCLQVLCELSQIDFETKVFSSDVSQKAKLISNWMIGKLFSALNKECLDISKSKVSSINLAGIIYRQDDGTLSSKTAEELFFILWKNDTADLDDLILANDLSQIRDETGLVRMIEDVLDKNCKMVEQYLAGKEKALNALVGQVMKLSKGKANAQLVKEKILEKISKD